jgi:hypothetical protein
MKPTAQSTRILRSLAARPVHVAGLQRYVSGTELPGAGTYAVFETLAEGAWVWDEREQPQPLAGGQRFLGVLSPVYGAGEREGNVPRSGDASLHLMHPGGLVAEAADHCLTGDAIPVPVRLIGLVLDEQGREARAALDAEMAVRPGSAREQLLAWAAGRLVLVLDAEVAWQPGGPSSGGNAVEHASPVRALADAACEALTEEGLRVARLQVNGSGPCPSGRPASDAVLHSRWDELGCPSTYLMEPEKLEELLLAQLEQARQAGAQRVVLEFGQPVYQRETLALLNDSVLVQLAPSVLLAAPSPMAALGASSLLDKMGYAVEAVGGPLLSRKLACGEWEVLHDAPLATTDALLDWAGEQSVRSVPAESASSLDDDLSELSLYSRIA